MVQKQQIYSSKISSIIQGKPIFGNNNSQYTKQFLNQLLGLNSQKIIVSEINSDINFNLNCTKLKNFNFNEEITKKLIMVIKSNFKKYNYLLSVECGISLEQSKTKLNNIINYINSCEDSFQSFTSQKYSQDDILLKNKGRILISLSGSDPFEGFINSFLPAIYLQNEIYIKPSRKNCLLIHSLFQDLIKIGFDKSYLNLLIISNNYFIKLIENNFFNFIYWTGSYNSAKLIQNYCINSNTEFYYEGSGLDCLYIHNSFTDWEKLELTILNSLTNLNGLNCNAIRGIFIDSEISSKLENKIKLILKKITTLKTLNQSGYTIKQFNKTEINNIKSIENKIISKTSHNSNKSSAKILFNIQNLSEISNLEIFAPIIWVKLIKDLSEISNFYKSTQFGLSFTIFSNSDLSIQKLINKVSVSRININKDPLDVSFLEPWGGIKKSGVGGAKNWLLKFSNEIFISQD